MPPMKPPGTTPAAPPSDAASAAAPGPGNPKLQQILSSLPPEKQEIVKTVMTDPDMLRVIDQITEILAPEVAMMQGPGPTQDEAMFGPKL